VQRAGDLVRRILTFSRRQPPVRQAVQLGPVVGEAVRLLRAVLPATVELRADLPADAGAVLADATQVHQVVMNLCSNAAQALGDRGGQIVLELARVSVGADFARAHAPLRAGEHVRLAVRDNGPGMDGAVLRHIFEPFFTTKAPGTGTGLGLAMVHGIVHNHEGAIVASSERGIGTMFELYFPVAHTSPAEGTAPEPRPLRGWGEHVLFVDDEGFLVQLGGSILQRLGYRVSTFTDPLQALAAFRSAPGDYAAVITDLLMPRLKGLELARQVLQVRPDVPVILTSGYTGTSDEEEARALARPAPAK
jgi:CheY-like chemotaxis protein